MFTGDWYATTVFRWNSFTYSLTVVAPGIAEALLATIVGLAAAIPAVIGYNWANNKLKYLGDRANMFSQELLARLKRDRYL